MYHYESKTGKNKRIKMRELKYELNEVEMSKIKFSEYSQAVFKTKTTETTINGFGSGESTFKLLCDSIDKIGLIHPITINKDYMILSGHRRYLAFQKLGKNTIPCIRILQDIKDTERLAIEHPNFIVRGERTLQNAKQFVIEYARKELGEQIKNNPKILDQKKVVEFSKNTGIKEHTVKDAFKQIKKEVTREKNKNEYLKNNVDQTVVLGFKSKLTRIESEYYTFNKKTKQAVNKSVDEFYKKMLKLRNE